MSKQKIIWQICDGKRGHENQSAGLIYALAKLIPVEVVHFDVPQHAASWWQGLRGVFPAGTQREKPDLIIAAGSQTHASLFAAGRATRTPTIMIMAPPRGLQRLFDLCIVPMHDQRRGGNIVETTGAINLIDCADHIDAPNGLFLIGGPSQHHEWDSDSLTRQISDILQANPEISWTLTNSRRTPSETMDSIKKQFSNKARIILVDNTGADWLPRELARNRYVWVTEDSVSMIYEALSSGAKVGALPVPRKSRNSRVIRGVDQLIQNGQVWPYRPDQCDLSNVKAPAPLNEAARVAQIIAQKFFNH